MKKYQKLGLVLALGLGSAGAANATVLYNNLGDGSATNDVEFFADGYIASEFSTTKLCPSGCTLSNITLNLTAYGSPDPSSYQLQVFADVGGAPSGAALLSFANPVGGFFTGTANYSFTPSGNYLFGASGAPTNYWLELIGKNTNNNDYLGWDTNSSTQTIAGQLNQGTWNIGGFKYATSNLLMEVDGVASAVKVSPPLSSVPIPATVWLMASAFIGMMSVWRKKAA